MVTQRRNLRTDAARKRGPFAPGRWDDDDVADTRPPAKTTGADTNGSDTTEAVTADAPTAQLKADTEHEPEPKAADEAPAAPTPSATSAQTTRAALAAATAQATRTALAASATLAASIASAAPKAAPVAKRWLTHLREFRPSPMMTLAILGGLAGLSVVGGLAFPNSVIGQACAIVLVPGLCIAVGIAASRWYSKHAPDHHSVTAIRTPDYPTPQLDRSVRFVDDRLSAAQVHLQNGHTLGVLIEIVRAKTATELAMGTEQQPSYPEMPGSASSEQAPRAFDDDDQMRPRITNDKDSNIARTPSATTTLTTPDEGSVARVEDQYTLIINRGSEHGVKPDMVFAVMAERGDEIIDPENGEVIGELPVEKLRVKVLDVQPKYSWAATLARAEVGHESLTVVASGACDSLDRSVSELLPAGEAPKPARQKISHEELVRTTEPPVLPEVIVNIGDRLRRIAP